MSINTVYTTPYTLEGSLEWLVQQEEKNAFFRESLEIINEMTKPGVERNLITRAIMHWFNDFKEDKKRIIQNMDEEIGASYLIIKEKIKEKAKKMLFKV